MIRECPTRRAGPIPAWWMAYYPGQRVFRAFLSATDLLSYTRRVSKEVGVPVNPAGLPAGRRSDPRPGQTIRKVLDAGLEELRESSYTNLTMRAVATRAGVSAASAYTYFPSKSALV